LTSHRIDTQKKFEAVTYGGSANDPIEIRFDFDALAIDVEFLNSISNAQAVTVLVVDMHQQRVRKVQGLRDELERLIATEQSQSP
jgi:hypothetical protein